MIFVTVGTHEQQFNRLVEYMDNWAMANDEDVVIQIGYSTYEPKKAIWSNFFPYTMMKRFVEEARIVITHGGPSSFIMPLQIGKTPIVVPRKYDYKEHVNNHQIDFCREVENRMRNIIVIEDVNNLDDVIINYDIMKNKEKKTSNNAKFCDALENLIDEMFRK